MAKKKTTKEETKDKAVEAASKLTAEKLAAIREFNMQNVGSMWIDPEKVPSDEDVEQAKKDYEERAIALKDKKDYFIADKANALRVAKFLKDFIENSYWQKQFFVGVINFSEYITTFINECEKEPKDLVMEYGPMQFAFLMLDNRMGHGLEDAKHMAEIWDEFVPIYDTLHELDDWYKKEVETIKRLQNRWGMLAQGYYLVLLDPEDHKQEEILDSSVESKKE